MAKLNVPHPYYLTTAEESQQLDAQTIESFGIDGYTLMEIAGSKAAEQLIRQYNPGQHGLYLCGKGNNGGDALVVARYLVHHGIKATLAFISGTDDLSKDANKNFELLRKIANEDSSVSIDIHTEWKPDDLTGSYDFIVDGMLGTGLNSDLRGDYEKAVHWANNSDLPLHAIDIPTGLHADTGQAMGASIKADQTFAFGSLKQGFYLNEGPYYAGIPAYCDLPFPNYLKNDFSNFLIDEKWMEQRYPFERSPVRHKYEAGVLYLVAGSEGLTGAAQMAARSAWAEGLGATIIICPRGLLPIFETNLIQHIKKPVGTVDDFHFSEEHLDDVLDIIHEKEGKVLFGPGLGRAPETLRFTQQFLSRYEGDVLIDADGLWCLAQEPISRPENSRWILTPHPGELTNILNTKIKDDNDRLIKVKSYSREQDITVVSKGYPVIVGTSEGNGYLTGYDTRNFARAGFGDVLAGKISAFWTLTGSTVQSCIRGLLSGKQKMENHNQNSIAPLEPFDLI